MKKILLAFILICFLVTNSYALSAAVQASLGASSSTPSTTYIYVAGSDNYPDLVSGETAILGDSVVLSEAHTLTKLGFKLSSVSGVSACWIALYNSDSTSLLAHEHVTSPATGWNDVTINYSASAATYMVWVHCDASYGIYRNAAGEGTTPKYSAVSWGGNPPAYIESGPSTGNFSARVGY